MDPSACSSPVPCDLPPAQALQPQNLSPHLELEICGIGNIGLCGGRCETHSIQTVAVSRSFSVPFINTTPPGVGAAEWCGGLARVVMYPGCVQTTSGCQGVSSRVVAELYCVEGNCWGRRVAALISDGVFAVGGRLQR